MKNHSIFLIVAALALLTLASCRKDELRAPADNGNVIRFCTSVRSGKPETKAMSWSDEVLVSKDASLREELSFDEKELTRGALINTSGSNQALPSEQSFYVSAWTGTEKDFGYEVVRHRTDVNGDGYWITVQDDKDKEYIWHQEEEKLFFAYANLPAGGAAVTNTDNKLQTLSYTVPSTAAAQTDILLGHYKGQGDNGKAGIVFQHALTAVRFAKGTIKSQASIVRIKLSGVAAAGSLTMADDGTLSAWNVSGNYDGEVYADITEDHPELLEEPFLLIPQVLSEHHVTLTITLSNGVELNANINTDTWYAGRTNTYTIGFRGNELMVLGDVAVNYDVTEGPCNYYVNCNPGTEWVLQYTTDGGANWYDAVADQFIDDWIKFDVVSGTGGEDTTTVTATVVAANDPLKFNLNHIAELKDAPAKGSDLKPYDLSMYTVSGVLRKKPTTANSYVISSRGWYAFPLVYGNALRNGVDNKGAYAPSLSPQDTVLTPFVDSKGEGIESPYIQGATAAFPLWEDVPDFSLIASDGCRLLSQAEAEEMELACKCPYVMFNISGETISQGNVLIAVADASDNILWSWQIWVTDNDLSTIPVGNMDNNIAMMPLNLGAVDIVNETQVDGFPKKTLQLRFVHKKNGKFKSSVDKVALRKSHALSPSEMSFFSCPTYQWGRKDPFIRNYNDVYNNNNGQEIPDEFRSVRTGYSAIDATHYGPVELGYAIAHPNFFFITDSERKETRNWSRIHYRNLWSATTVSDIETDKSRNGGISTIDGYSSAPVKTIYDPCPPGYQIPQGDFTCNYSKDGGTNERSGFRRNTNITFANIGKSGNYFHAVLADTDGSYLVGPSNFHVTSYGDLVRPVVEP